MTNGAGDLLTKSCSFGFLRSSTDRALLLQRWEYTRLTMLRSRELPWNSIKWLNGFLAELRQDLMKGRHEVPEVLLYLEEFVGGRHALGPGGIDLPAISATAGATQWSARVRSHSP